MNPSRNNEQNPYQLLEVSPNADMPLIHAAYRRLAKLYHPDITGSEDSARFRKIQRAYELLSNPSRRAAYDARLRKTQSTPRPQHRPHPTSPNRTPPEEETLLQKLYDFFRYPMGKYRNPLPFREKLYNFFRYPNGTNTPEGKAKWEENKSFFRTLPVGILGGLLFPMLYVIFLEQDPPDSDRDSLLLDLALFGCFTGMTAVYYGHKFPLWAAIPASLATSPIFIVVVILEALSTLEGDESLPIISYPAFAYSLLVLTGALTLFGKYMGEIFFPDSKE